VLKEVDHSQEIINSIKVAIGTDTAVLHEPRFNGNEWTYLKDCLDSTFVSSVGQYVDRFEKELAGYTNAAHAVAVVNGTSALHMALQIVGVKSNDEVLIPSLTFVATANAVRYCGAIPHFVDSDFGTLGIDPVALRDHLKTTTDFINNQCINKQTGRVIRAIVPMHTFGHPVNINEILAVARDFHLVVIEDAAESLGSTVSGKHTGTFGELGIISFNGNKTITTGGGGAIITNNTELAKLAKHLTTTAKLPHRWEYTHDEVGYNYRMPNINAALGCAQLEQLPDFIDAKRHLFVKYQSAFADLPYVRLVSEPVDCHSNYWLQTLILDETIAEERNDILAATNEAGLMTRPIWNLLHNLKPFKGCPRMDLSVAISLEKRLLNLPSSVHLGEENKL